MTVGTGYVQLGYWLCLPPQLVTLFEGIFFMPKLNYDDTTPAELEALHAAQQYFGHYYRSSIQAIWVVRKCPTVLVQWMPVYLDLQMNRGASWLNSFDFSKVKKKKEFPDA